MTGLRRTSVSADGYRRPRLPPWSTNLDWPSFCPRFRDEEAERQALRAVMGSGLRSISPFIAPTPAVGETGCARILCTMSIPSIT